MEAITASGRSPACARGVGRRRKVYKAKPAAPTAPAMATARQSRKEEEEVAMGMGRLCGSEALLAGFRGEARGFLVRSSENAAQITPGDRISNLSRRTTKVHELGSCPPRTPSRPEAAFALQRPSPRVTAHHPGCHRASRRPLLAGNPPAARLQRSLSLHLAAARDETPVPTVQLPTPNPYEASNSLIAHGWVGAVLERLTRQMCVVGALSSRIATASSPPPSAPAMPPGVRSSSKSEVRLPSRSESPAALRPGRLTGPSGQRVARGRISALGPTAICLESQQLNHPSTTLPAHSARELPLHHTYLPLLLLGPPSSPPPTLASAQTSSRPQYRYPLHQLTHTHLAHVHAPSCHVHASPAAHDAPRLRRLGRGQHRASRSHGSCARRGCATHRVAAGAYALRGGAHRAGLPAREPRGARTG